MSRIMSRTPIESAEAFRLLSAGSTKGIVRRKLVDSGLSEHLADEAIAIAASAVNRRAKLVSVFVALLGAALSALGIVLLLVGINLPAWVVKFPVAVVVSGAIVFLYGCHGAVTRRI